MSGFTFIHSSVIQFLVVLGLIVVEYVAALLASDADVIEDGVVEGLLKVPSPSNTDRPAVPRVDKVRCRHLFFTDWIRGVEDLSRVSRSSHGLFGRGNEHVEDLLRFVERSAGSRTEVFRYPLTYHLLEVDRSHE